MSVVYLKQIRYLNDRLFVCKFHKNKQVCLFFNKERILLWLTEENEVALDTLLDKNKKQRPFLIFKFPDAMSLLSVSKLHTFTGHKDCIYTLEQASEPGTFFSAGADGLVAEWNVARPEEGRLVAKANTSVYALKYLEEEHLLVIGQNFDGIRIIDLRNMKDKGSLKINQAAIFSIEAYNGKLFIGGGDGMLTVVSLEPLQIIFQEKVSEKSLRSIKLFPEQSEFAAGFSDNTIKIFNLIDYKIKQLIEAHANSVFTLTYSPDYKYLLSGSRDARLNVWRTNGIYHQAESIVAHMYAINHIAYSPDGRFFASCSMDKAVKLWDAESFRLLKVIDRARHAGHGTSVNRLLWLQDNILLSASDDRTISAWNIETEQ